MARLESFPLDVRVREMNLKRGIITRKEVETHLKDLPDESAWIEEVSLDEVDEDND